jgi:hypothetical protein
VERTRAVEVLVKVTQGAVVDAVAAAAETAQAAATETAARTNLNENMKMGI